MIAGNSLPHYYSSIDVSAVTTSVHTTTRHDSSDTLPKYMAPIQPPKTSSSVQGLEYETTIVNSTESIHDYTKLHFN